MRAVVVVVAVVVCWFLCCAQARAQAAPDSSGHDLLKRCGTVARFSDDPGAVAAFTDEESVDFGYCVGFLSATSGVLRNTVLADRSEICLPADLTIARVADVVVQYLRGHPDRLDQPDIGLTLSALEEAYPCKSP